MLSKIFSTACLVVVAWLIMQISGTQESVKSVRRSMDTTVATLQTSISENQAKAQVNDQSLLEKIDLVIEQQEGEEVLKTTRKELAAAKAQVGANNKKLKDQSAKITKIELQKKVRQIYLTVLEAEIGRRDKQGTQSSEKLKSIKADVWKLSEKVPDSQDKLRALMAPIDVISGEWKRGDFSKDSKNIQQVLAEVLKKLG